MLFNSFHFLLFFPIVCIIVWNLTPNKRWAALLASSCIFYMDFIPLYILILFGVILIDFFASHYIYNSKAERKKLFLFISLAANIGILAVFKYYNFFIENYNYILSYLGFQIRSEYLSLILPVGLSFHTFQAMSYNIEVYKGNYLPEKKLGTFALYVLFFPQLVAGPIERPQTLLPQLKTGFNPTDWDITVGCRYMLWGFFKKIYIADNLSYLTQDLFSNTFHLHGLVILLYMMLFFIQIYCDFSGYTDIATGTARFFGIKMSENFKSPLISTSFKDFWNRWHISLTNWFRSYVYIPLGGSKKGAVMKYFNLSFIFLLSGFWHGAYWTFILWGALHALLVIFNSIFDDYLFEGHKNKSSQINKLFNIGFVFVSISLVTVFFGVRSINESVNIFRNLFSFPIFEISEINSQNIFSKIEIMLLGLSIVFLFFMEFMLDKYKLETLISRMKPVSRQIAYCVLLYLIIFYGAFESSKFIYYDF